MDSLATYSELLIGLQQTGSMTELYLMVKQTTLALQYDQHLANLNSYDGSLVEPGSF